MELTSNQEISGGEKVARGGDSLEIGMEARFGEGLAQGRKEKNLGCDGRVRGVNGRRKEWLKI